VYLLLLITLNVYLFCDTLVISGKMLFVDQPGIITILTIEHKQLSSGHKVQVLLEEEDLFEYLKSNTIDENFCRKNPVTNVQKKFSCNSCRIIIEGVAALTGHLAGSKHLQSVKNPLDNSEFIIQNGKWRKRKASTTIDVYSTKLSKRERTKQNKIVRDIPILPQHTEAKFEETETYFEKDLRKVRPYYFTFTTHAKGRWCGDKLSDVFAREFRAMEPQEYKRCIEEGFIKVNDKPSSVDYIVKNNDFITHVVHRHELPVTGQKIQVIHEDSNWVVVDKPPSIPVHPCGRYRHNTVIFILAKELGYRQLNTVHRLDRLTSGVLIFSKNSAKARMMEQLIRTREVEKEYVCRVQGEFPEEEIVCEQPLEVISYKIGLVVVDPKGKECKTTFRRVSFKDGVSIVRCLPKSGRMHQIRVHLQYLGFPIANDPLYNSTIFGPDKGKNGEFGKSNEQLIEDMIKFHSVENWIESDEYKQSRIETKEEKISKDGKGITPELGMSDNNEKDVVEVEDKCNDYNDRQKYFDKHCVECRTVYKDPPPDTLIMYLHALRYSGQDWSYSTAMPS